jgi:hypothetical protein
MDAAPLTSLSSFVAQRPLKSLISITPCPRQQGCAPHRAAPDQSARQDGQILDNELSLHIAVTDDVLKIFGQVCDVVAAAGGQKGEAEGGVADDGSEGVVGVDCDE